MNSIITRRHVIYLPNGNPCPLAVYARAWKRIKEKPGALYPGFFHFPERGHDIIKKIREGMHDRISLNQPWYRRGRKWDEYGYQKDMMQAASMLNHPRLIIDWLPPSLERRFAHRLRRNLID